MHKENFDIGIIGGGGAGTMAYLRSVLNHDRVIFFMGNADTKRRGRGTWVGDVENIPGLHGMARPVIATQKSTLNWIQKQDSLKEFGEPLSETVTSIRKEEKCFVLSYKNKKEEEEEVRVKFVVMATGIMDKQPLIQGSMDPVFPFANRGDLLYCIRCDGHRTYGHRVSVLGNGDAAVNIAAVLKERYGHKEVPILTNGEKMVLSSSSQDLLKLYDFPVFESPIRRILGDPKEGLKGFQLEAENQTVSTDRSIVALGTIVYNELAKQMNLHLDADEKIVVSSKYETSEENVFAVGDVISGKKMQIYTAWDEAVDAADEINRRLRMEKRNAFQKEKS